MFNLYPFPFLSAQACLTQVFTPSSNKEFIGSALDISRTYVVEKHRFEAGRLQFMFQKGPNMFREIYRKALLYQHGLINCQSAYGNFFSLYFERLVVSHD